MTSNIGIRLSARRWSLAHGTSPAAPVPIVVSAVPAVPGAVGPGAGLVGSRVVEPEEGVSEGDVERSRSA
jgi:hypothetical protein